MNKMSIFKILIFSILASNIFAQADYKASTIISLKPVWKKGESYQYELVKGKINYFEEQEANRSENHQTVTISVLEVTAKGYVMEAVYNSVAYFLPDEIKHIKDINKIIEQYRQNKVRYRVSPTGEFLNISNGREIQRMLIDLFDLVEKSTVKDDMTATLVANMRCQMTSEVYITEGLFQELRLFHQFYGNQYPANASQEYDTELANMLEPQGKPIPAKASLKLSWLEDKHCLVEHTLAPDEAIMQKLTFDYFKKMSKGAMEVSNTEGVSLTVQDEGKYVFHQPSAWLIDLYKTRTIHFEREKTVEFVKMMLLDRGSF